MTAVTDANAEQATQDRRRWFILAIVSLSQLMVVLDITVVNVALPERKAGRPPIGLANGWFYAAASQQSAFFDVAQGDNDLRGVGCCQTGGGYDMVSGLGVPNWSALPAALPRPG